MESIMYYFLKPELYSRYKNVLSKLLQLQLRCRLRVPNIFRYYLLANENKQNKTKLKITL